MASLPLPETGSLADFGCSDGYIIGLIRERFLRDRAWTFHGFDVKQELLDRASAKDIPGASFQYLDLNQFGISSEGRFDLVLCLETVEHTGNYRNAVLNVVRSCRPGGHILISAPQEKGWRGLIKLVGRKILQRDPYGEFFVGKSRWKYVRAMLTKGDVEQFRQPPRDGWGPHLGFDTDRFEKFLQEDLFDTGSCRLIDRRMSFVGFNRLYIIRREKDVAGERRQEGHDMPSVRPKAAGKRVERGAIMSGNRSRVGEIPILKDQRTVDYFDSHLPEYSDKRSVYIEDVLNRLATEESSLVDIGCGAGTLLKQIEKNTPIRKFCGIDLSEKILEKCKERVNCDIYRGSICDAEFMRNIPEKFDFAIVASVLHHLIWKNRKQSMEFAKQAVENSLKVVKDGGYLILLEPTFHPAFMMSALFYVKKLVTKFTTKRVGILGYWNNIGEPVVSYFTDQQLIAMLASIDGCEIYETFAERQGISWVIRMAGIWGRANSFVVLRKGKA
jgi:2-polyprenyl-3-methyl-5-hydroxy-6-metoxy-1,4-benzoquinol methylase